MKMNDVNRFSQTFSKTLKHLICMSLRMRRFSTSASPFQYLDSLRSLGKRCLVTEVMSMWRLRIIAGRCTRF